MHRPNNSLTRIDQGHTKSSKQGGEPHIDLGRRSFSARLAFVGGVAALVSVGGIVFRGCDDSSEEPRKATDAEIQANIKSLLEEYKVDLPKKGDRPLSRDNLKILGEKASQLNPIFERDWSRMTAEQQQTVIDYNERAMKTLSHDSSSKEYRMIVRYQQGFLSKRANADNIEQSREAINKSLSNAVE